MATNSKEPIAFFTHKKDNEVICLYLNVEEKPGYNLMYAHDGQHGSCDPRYVEENFRLSVEGEYENMLAELKSLPPVDEEFDVVNDMAVIKDRLHHEEVIIESILVDIPASGNVSVRPPKN